jgi:cupin fold WbuC family metalloprotein
MTEYLNSIAKLDSSRGIIDYSGKFIALNELDIERLVNQVDFTEKKRIRICLHSPGDLIHEMIILVKKGSYIRPAKHINKTESLHVIKGRAKAVFFNDDGDIECINILSRYPESYFIYRMNTDIFHTLIVDSEHFIFHETTNGPLNRSDTVEANWAPKENDVTNREKYMLRLKERIKSFSHTTG